MMMMMPIPANDINTDESNDDESCTICGKDGLLTQCDGCRQWNHWQCVDKYHQPTSGPYFCTGCRDANDAHPLPWEMQQPTTEWPECCICTERKPKTQFIGKILPECQCKFDVCAGCAYTMVDKAGPENAGSKCPFCRTQWTAFETRTEFGIEAVTIQLNHKHGQEGDKEDEEDAAELAAYMTETPTSVATSVATSTSTAAATATPTALDTAPISGLLTSVEPHDSDDGEDVLRMMFSSDDDDDDDDDDDYDDDDDDSVVDGTPSARLARRPERPRQRSSNAGKPKKPKKTISKAAGSVRGDYIIVCTSPTEVNPNFQQKTPGKVSSRVKGSVPIKEAYTEARRKEVQLLCDERLTLIPRKNAKSKIDFSEMHAEQYDMYHHLKILMIKAGDAMGGGGKKADKYPRYLLKITGEDGLSSKICFENRDAWDGVAWKACEAAAKKVEETNEKKIASLANDYWNAYVTYCKYLKEEEEGTLVAEP